MSDYKIPVYSGSTFQYYNSDIQEDSRYYSFGARRDSGGTTTFLKYGITSEKDPRKRYTDKDMKNKQMIVLDKVSRSEMLKKKEFLLKKAVDH